MLSCISFICINIFVDLLLTHLILFQNVSDFLLNFLLNQLQKLHHLLLLHLQHLQLSRHQNIYIANTVKCRPPYNREPTDAEMNNCQDFLLQQIGLIQPKIIVCLGKVAFYALFKTQLNLPKSCSVSRYRKKMFNLSYQYKKQQYKIPTFITYHPSYLLRSPVQKVETWKDLCLAKHFYDTQITKN